MKLDGVFDTVVRALPLPNVAEEGIILAKNYLKDEENQNKIWSIFQNIFSKKNSIVKDIWEVKEKIKDKGVEQGIIEALDIAISNARKNKIISKETANILQNGKEIIADKIANQKEDFLGQEKILNKINDKYNKWEEALKINDIEGMERIGTQIKNDSKKLMPTIELIKKIEDIENTIKLYKNKIVDGETKTTVLENEILNKIA